MESNNTKILIISATSKNNLVLANQLSGLIDVGYSTEILNLEDLELPLFVPGIECDRETVNALVERFRSAHGFIFCAPEYNGCVPTILSNTIAWITTFSNDWRDAFNGKIAIIASHSSGPAYSFLSTFRDQLEYLGTIVMPRTIMVKGDQTLNERSVHTIVSGFTKILNNQKGLD